MEITKKGNNIEELEKARDKQEFTQPHYLWSRHGRRLLGIAPKRMGGTCRSGTGRQH
jgi:hypothetical protein